MDATGTIATVWICGVSGALAFIQTGMGAGSIDTVFGSAERLTLIGALVVAVGVLWKSNGKKDEMVVEMVKSVTETLVTAADSNKELRKIVEESVAAKKDLRESIESLKYALGVLPCVRDEDVGNGKKVK